MAESPTSDQRAGGYCLRAASSMVLERVGELTTWVWIPMPLVWKDSVVSPGLIPFTQDHFFFFKEFF